MEESTAAGFADITKVRGLPRMHNPNPKPFRHEAQYLFQDNSTMKTEKGVGLR